MEAIAEALDRGGHLVYIGAGTSGRLGVLDASECPPTFNVSPDLVRGIIAGGEEALIQVDRGDRGRSGRRRRGICSLPDSGREMHWSGSPPAAGPRMFWAQSRRRGTWARSPAGISCTPDSELSRAVDFPIEPKPGPEILTGSTRLRAGTATKMVLNMISTAVMIRLGYVYGNLMVNVQPTNAETGRSRPADHLEGDRRVDEARRGAAGTGRPQRADGHRHGKKSVSRRQNAEQLPRQPRGDELRRR